MKKEQSTADISKFEDLQFSYNCNTINTDFFPTKFELHWHKYIEIAALPENATIEHLPVLRINQTIYELHPGDVLFMWPGELHEILENQDKQLIGVQFSSTLFHTLPDFSPYLNFFRTFHLIRQEETPELAQNMQIYLNHMLAVEKIENPFCGVEILIHLCEMFIEFGTHINHTLLKDTISLTNRASSSLEKINLACRYIAENCNQPLTLNTVADYIGFSTCYFSRIFKQATKYNFAEYLTLQRVRRAEVLLSDSSLAITEISFQSGFRSISTFNRSFREIRGCSPSEYRHYYLS